MSSTIRPSASKARLLRTALQGQLCSYLKPAKATSAHPLSNFLCKLTQPSRCFKTAILCTLEKLCRKSLALDEKNTEKQAETQTIEQADLQNFRFHPSTQLLTKQGYYATAYQLSLTRVIKDARLFPLRQTQLSAFAPKLCNVMVGMDKYGDQYIHAFQPLAADSHLYRITESQPAADCTLPQGIRRRMRHATPGGVAIAKAFIRPPQKFEIFIDRSHTVYLQQTAGNFDFVALDDLSSSFKAANVSANGHFAALITAEGSVRRYDNQQGCMQEVDLNGDSEAITISIANDGTLYIGSRQHTYMVPAGSKSAIKQGRGLEQNNKIFCLSVDERFLISQRCNSRGTKKSEILLHDLQNEGQEIVLSSAQPRTQPDSTRPCSIAFSQLNALVAVGYQNGLIEIFALENLCAPPAVRNTFAASALAQQGGITPLRGLCKGSLPNPDTHKPDAQLVTSLRLPQYSALPPCPLVSFAKGFDQLHVTYRGRNNAVELGTLTFGIAQILSH